MVATAAEAEKLRRRCFNADREKCHDAIETDCTRKALVRTFAAASVTQYL